MYMAKSKKIKKSNMAKSSVKKIGTDSDYVIAIPSYKREKTLRDKTLKVLKQYKIPKEKIFIFVANKDEYNKYKETIPPYYNKIIVGIVGMGNIRNFITDYFPEGKKIFNMDDDISGFLKLTKEKTKTSKGEIIKLKGQ